MKPAPPVVDQDSVDQDSVARTEALLRRYTGWPAAGERASGAGGALVHAFASLADTVAERVNRVPDKNLLAFLDLIGVRPRPPQPARVPLMFTLAVGATGDVVVPARTRVAAEEAPGDSEAVVFETDRDLTVTAAVLQAVRTRDPGRDRYGDAGAGSCATGPFGAFDASLWIGHRLYIGHDIFFGLAERNDIHVRFGGVTEAAQWPAALAWERWDGTEWVAVAARPQRVSADTLAFLLLDMAPVPMSTVGGIRSRWLRARLQTSIPRLKVPADNAATIQRTGLLPDALVANGLALDGRRPVTPFVSDTRLLVRADEVFSKPGAAVTCSVGVDGEPQPSPDLTLAWKWFDGEDWKPLGEATPTTASGAAFADTTDALSRTGTVSFTVPAGWVAGRDAQSAGREREGRWLLVEVVAGGYGLSPPAIRRLDLSYSWPRPRLRPPLLLASSGNREPRGLDQAYVNATPVDVSKDFAPFGLQPVTGDTFYFACDDAFTAPRTSVALRVDLTNPVSASSAVTPPAATPGPGLLLRWEYFDTEGGRWTVLGDSAPGRPPVAGQPFTDATEGFTKDGQIIFTPPPAAIGTVAVNGVVRRWLRVRIARGDYGTTTATTTATTTPHPPWVKSITASYAYSSGATPLPPTAIVAENDFAYCEPAVQADGLITPFTPSVDQEPTLYLGFDRAFSNQAIALYFAVQDAAIAAEQRAATGGGAPPVVVWEFWDGATGGWSRLETRDETLAFARRGLVTFVGPPSAAPSSQFGRVAYWLRSRWVKGDYPGPPTLERVSLNTTWALHQTTIDDEVIGSSTGQRDQVFRATRAPVLAGERLEVREGEGEGEGPAAGWVGWQAVVDFNGSEPGDRHYVIDRATAAVRFGDAVRGRIPPRGRDNIRLTRYRTGGGEAGNRPVAAISRLLSTVPYVDAVTNHEGATGGVGSEPREALVDRGPRILRHGDRAVVASDFEDLARDASASVARATAIASASHRADGRVGVVIVPCSDAPRPVPSSELVDRVAEYLRLRCAATFDLWVGAPGWLRIDVDAELVPVAIELATDVENAVRARLRAFLHPLTGGSEGNGWPLGRRVFRSHLEAVIHAAPEVHHVRTLRVAEHVEAAAPAPGAFMIYSGEHRIRVVGEPRGGP